MYFAPTDQTHALAVDVFWSPMTWEAFQRPNVLQNRRFDPLGHIASFRVYFLSVTCSFVTVELLEFALGFAVFKFWSFEFVLDFEIRASIYLPAPHTRCTS